MILWTGPHNTVYYISGATGNGRQQLCMHAHFQLAYIGYFFIKSDQDVRAWMLSNPGLENSWDLMVDCHFLATGQTATTVPLWEHNDLPENVIANWARQAGPYTDIQAPQRGIRPDPCPPHACGNQGNDSAIFLPVSTNSSSDVSDFSAGIHQFIIWCLRCRWGC